MTKIKFYIKYGKIVTVLALIASCGRLHGEQVNTRNDNLILASVNYVPPPPPPKSGEPKGRGDGGASRGCEPMALVPIMKTNSRSYRWGQTVSERPQFWFTLPRSLTKQDIVEFTLKDNSGKQVYNTKLQSQIPQGIVSFTIPDNIPPLQVGKTYDWSFLVRCNSTTVEDRPGKVEGGIQRVVMSTTVKNQLAGAKTPVEQASVYAKNGIWFDSLTILAEKMRDNKTNDISSAWTELLKQVNLEKATKAPVINCCTQV